MAITTARRVFQLLTAITLAKDASLATFGIRHVPKIDQDDFPIEYVNNCPPIGSEEKKFYVMALDGEDPRVTGCAWMQPRSIEFVPAFELWLGRKDNDSPEGCSSSTLNMDHFLFECLAKYPANEDDPFYGWWYLYLYNEFAHWTDNPPDFNCAMYRVVTKEPMLIMMLISGSRSCFGLQEKLTNSSELLISGPQYHNDGTIILLLSSETIVGNRKK